MKSFFFPFCDSIMYYFTYTLFSVSATITEIATTPRCTIKIVHIIWTTISHFDVCWPSIAVTTMMKTHRPGDLTVCYCRVSTIQPAGCSSVTSECRWTWSCHSCTGGPLKTELTRSDSIVTRKATVVRNLSGITVKASVILTFWYSKKKKNNDLTFKKLENHWIFWYFFCNLLFPKVLSTVHKQAQSG